MPNEYISREAACLFVKDQNKIHPETIFGTGFLATIAGLQSLPAADVAPVVRCGECIHRVNMEHSMDNKEICCGRMAMRVMALDDYCSHGVRMERRQPEGGKAE